MLGGKQRQDNYAFVKCGKTIYVNCQHFFSFPKKIHFYSKLTDGGEKDGRNYRRSFSVKMCFFFRTVFLSKCQSATLKLQSSPEKKETAERGRGKTGKNFHPAEEKDCVWEKARGCPKHASFLSLLLFGKLASFSLCQFRSGAAAVIRGGRDRRCNNSRRRCFHSFHLFLSLLQFSPGKEETLLTHATYRTRIGRMKTCMNEKKP